MKIVRSTPMSVKRAALAALLALLAGGAQAESSPGEAAGDEARLSALAKSAAGRPAEVFFAAQAQGWLWSAKHEEARNDASGYAERAREQARVAADRLERAREWGSGSRGRLAFSGRAEGGERGIPVRKWQEGFMRALGEGAARSDLERGLGGLLEGPGFVCSASELGRAYAMLSHARHALSDLGWRHADPYFRLSEARWAQARKLDAECSEADRSGGLSPSAGESERGEAEGPSPMARQ